MERKTIVIALGGNAILQAGQRGTAEEQLENIEATCRSIADLVEAGYRVVVTHGNGPQVGNILLQNEEASRVVPALPLDFCGAESQGMIGYMIQRSLANELQSRGIERLTCTVVTQVLVDPDDPAFENPSKPIGPYYNESKVPELEAKGYVMAEIPGRGWRRVVPSPEPKAIVEREVITKLVEAGVIVIASGGGGIPVAKRDDGSLYGVEAVIDKDLAGQKLARDVGAHIYLILTDVERACLNYGQEDEKPLGTLTPEEARKYVEEGHFAAGSMGPKVVAAVRFVEEGGERAIITALDRARDALEGETGTEITRNP